MMQRHSQSKNLREFDVWQIWSGLGGLPSLADRANRLGGSHHLSCKRDQIIIRDYMDRRVTPSKRVTSPTRGPPPLCKQALRDDWGGVRIWTSLLTKRTVNKMVLKPTTMGSVSTGYSNIGMWGWGNIDYRRSYDKRLPWIRSSPSAKLAMQPASNFFICVTFHWLVLHQ